VPPTRRRASGARDQEGSATAPPEPAAKRPRKAKKTTAQSTGTRSTGTRATATKSTEGRATGSPSPGAKSSGQPGLEGQVASLTVLVERVAGDVDVLVRDADERVLAEQREQERRQQERQQQKAAEKKSSGGGLYGSDIGANLVAASVAEFVGTFLLVLAGTAVAVAALLEMPTAGAPYDSLAVALAFGLVLVALVAALGHVSGCHVNPAVTIGLAATKRFPWKLVPAYVGAQVLGAVLASLVVWASFGSAARDDASLGAPDSGQAFGSAFLVEAVITFLLVFIVVSVATDDRVPQASAGLAVGFALAAGVFVGGPLTGGSVNPARALGPMIVSGEFPLVAVYVLAPLIGGVVAAALYAFVVGKGDAPGDDVAQSSPE
jgi:MIP family channel proteins